MSTVGIIMATYNGAGYLREQLDSILNNLYTDWKLWACDDGSTDETISILEEYAGRFPEKIILHKNIKNAGVALNFLQALKRSDTRYTMFSDQDDIWKKDKIQITLNGMLKAEKNYGSQTPIAVYTDAAIVNAKLEPIADSFFRASGLNTNHLGLNYILMENKVQGCTAMVNEAVRMKLNCLPEQARMHDWWIALLCSCFGRIEFLDTATLLYRQHENNVVGNQNFLSYLVDRIGSIKKQKAVLRRTQRQAEEFYQIYQKELKGRNLRLLQEFSSLSERNWLVRRYLVIKYGFQKTGLIRNMGVLLII